MDAASKKGWSSAGSTPRRNSAFAATACAIRPVKNLSSPDQGPLMWTRRAPDVIEIEPLGRVLAHDRFQHGDPGTRCFLFAPRRDHQRLRHLHRVPIDSSREGRTPAPAAPRRRGRARTVRAETARAIRRRGSDVDARAKRPVPLHRHHLTAPKRGDQLQRDGRARPWHEAHAVTVPAYPTLQLTRLLRCHHHVRRPGRTSGQEAPRQLPIANMSGERNEPAPESVTRSVPSTRSIWATNFAAGRRFVDSRSLKHMAKSVNVPTVSASSREPLAPVTRSRVRWIAARSSGMKRGARRPIARASPSRVRRGSQPSVAASR